MILINLQFKTPLIPQIFNQQLKSKASMEIFSKKTKKIFKSVLEILNPLHLLIQTQILTSTKSFRIILFYKIKIKSFNKKTSK